jgi:hypothetical protein
MRKPVIVPFMHHEPVVPFMLHPYTPPSKFQAVSPFHPR